MQEDNLKGNYAGFVSRLIAFGVDVAVIAVTLVIITWLINTVLQLFGLEDFSALETIMKVLLSGLFALLYSAAYFIFFWTLASQTPGKTLMGLRIVTTKNQALTTGRAIRRMFGYIVSIMALFLGFLWILVDNRRQGWHDKIAGTFVIYSWDARVGGYLGSWRQAQIDKEDQAK
jgi:uncharacterized RDD family membrane protein YckC